LFVGLGPKSANGGAQEGRICLAVNRAGWGEIWVMDPNGGNRVRLTEPEPPNTDASGSGSPAWSPDGRLVAYASTGGAVKENERDNEIYVMRADGSDKRRLTHDRASSLTPAWSPDGKRIAFSHVPGPAGSARDGVIAVMGADGRARSQITRHSKRRGVVILDIHPAWSPDGGLIAFTRVTYTRRAEPRVDMYAIEPSGTNEHLLIKDAAEPAWSPDGQQIAFTSTRDHFGETCFHDCSPSPEIYLATADGRTLRRLTKSQASDASPTWSPDGRHIAFSSDRRNRRDHEYEIYVIAADGGQLRRLTTNDVWDLDPSWR
jgi:TolB protein